jgi:peptide/nickel transport system permease protein
MIKALHLALRVAITVVLGGLLSASLVRFAPGFEADEELLDARRSDESLRKLRDERRAKSNVLAFYARFLKRYALGDLGESRLFHRSVVELLRERAVPTLIETATGLALGWFAGLVMALAAVRSCSPTAELSTTAPQFLLQCLPASVVALFLFSVGARGTVAGGLAVALVLYPSAVHFLRNMFRDAYSGAFILTARAKGLGRWRILFRHIIPVCGPQFLSLAGVSFSLALSATIPIETLLDIPGIGQLAWQAALARDLDLLINITVLMSLVVTACNALADSFGDHLSRPRGAAA